LDDDAWETYSRAKLQRGFVYPVERTVIERELKAAGARIAKLSMTSDASGHWAGTLLIAYWHPRDKPLLAKGARLSVYAVPPQFRVAVQRILRDSLLRSAADWLASVDRDSAWAGSDHRWRARLHGGTPVVDED
jgi:hypothetical protein